jgi:hypothetical protein
MIVALLGVSLGILAGDFRSGACLAESATNFLWKGKMNDLERGWQEYERKVIPRDAPFGQAIDCRRSFYCGAQFVLYVLSQMDNHRATEVEKDVACELMRDEVKLFLQRIRADLA